MSLNNKLPGLLMLDVKEPYEPSPTFALEPIGSSGDMTDKLGFLLSLQKQRTGMHTLPGAHPRGKRLRLKKYPVS